MELRSLLSASIVAGAALLSCGSAFSGDVSFLPPV